jgi:hypothetical protein
MTELEPLALEAFEELLDVHGADLARWPAEQRNRAERLLASSAAAQQLLARAARVAALLDALPDMLPSAELSARIAALPVRHPRRGGSAWWPFGNPLAPVLAWGAAAAFGLFVGSGAAPDLEPLFDGSAALSAQADSEARAEAGGAPAAPEPLVEAESGDDSASDDPDGDEWSELELALGLDSEWEEEP